MNIKYAERAFVTAFVLVILFAIHQLLASHLPAQSAPPHGAGDWPAWLGAIGTVGALFGTIYLANSQNAKARRDALSLARLSAAGMCHQQEMNEASLNSAVQSIKESIQSTRRVEIAFVPTSGIIQQAIVALQEIKLLSAEELMPLIAIDGDWVVRLASAQGRIPTYLFILDQLHVDRSGDELVEFLTEILNGLELSAKEFSQATKLFNQLKGRGAEGLS